MQHGHCNHKNHTVGCLGVARNTVLVQLLYHGIFRLQAGAESQTKPTKVDAPEATAFRTVLALGDDPPPKEREWK